MAQASIAKRRSIRSDRENAYGDHHRHSSHKESVEVQMVETRDNPLLAKLLGNREVCVMTAIAVAAYLIKGQHAGLLCTVLTSMPPAVFSYRVLLSQKTSKEGYHSILFYWTLYGLFALVDQFVSTTDGYNLIKGALLGAAFLHAVRSNPAALRQKTEQEKASSIFTRFDSYGFEKRTDSSGFIPVSPTITHFSESGLLEPSETLQEEEEEEMDVSTAQSFMPSLEMQTTQKKSPEDVQKRAFPSVRLGQKTVSATTTIGEDLVTVPENEIRFSRENRETCVRVTNISPLHVMFALKTNADTHLIAAPTTGILMSGQSLQMRIGLSAEHEGSQCIDKLAIDYLPIPPSFSTSITQFSPQFFQSQIRRRHALRVFYD